MSNELYKLPPGVNLPARYKRTIHSRQLFVQGAHDGFAGRPIAQAHERDMVWRQGQAAWQAYVEGHAAGTKARAS
jgi:hypothetical protein